MLSAMSFAACAREKAPAPHPKTTTLSAHTEQGRTVLRWTNAGGASGSVAVARDSTVALTSEPTNAVVAGEIADSMLVIVDSYPSIPGGMSFCQAGTERFLRVLSIAAAQPVETHRIKLASCLGNIELGADSTSWDASAMQLRINWLLGPGAAHAVESKTLHIGSDGRVQE